MYAGERLSEEYARTNSVGFATRKNAPALEGAAVPPPPDAAALFGAPAVVPDVVDVELDVVVVAAAGGPGPAAALPLATENSVTRRDKWKRRRVVIHTPPY
jgi:hypothetical protein